MKILFQGDSVTDAGRDRSNPHDMGEGYPRYASAMIQDSYPDTGFEFVNLGISGNRTADLVSRLESDFVDVQPDIVSVMIGINDVWHHYSFTYIETTDAEFEALLGRPIPDDTVKIDRNMTLGELNHSRSPLGWLIWAVLTALLNASFKKGKPDLNVLFQYNMPLRALAKMTSGAISMGMVDGIVMELQGFWIIGLVRVIIEAVKNLVLNAQLEQRLRNS